MAGKPELMTELYRRACLQVTSSPENWQAFLDSACRNYKCRFDEQLLIYMQRPDATAVLEYEKWNRRFGRWIKKNSRGIAVFETEITSRSIKYYFDISDTRAGENERPVSIWQMNEQYEETVPVRQQMSQMYDLKYTRSLVETLQKVAEQIVDNHIEAYLYDLKDCIDGGDLAQLDMMKSKKRKEAKTMSQITYIQNGDYQIPKSYLDYEQKNFIIDAKEKMEKPLAHEVKLFEKEKRLGESN